MNNFHSFALPLSVAGLLGACDAGPAHADDDDTAAAEPTVPGRAVVGAPAPEGAGGRPDAMTEFGAPPRVSAAGTTRPDIALMGDLNDDGEDEMIIWRSQDQKWFGLERDGTTRIFDPAGSEPVWGQPDDKPLVGDLDGDGRDEMILWRPSTGRWYAMHEDDDRVWDAGDEPTWGQAGDVPFVGDLNGDGTDEMIVWRPSNRRWYALYWNDITSTFTRIFLEGQEPDWTNGDDIQLVGDVDGDGKDDLVGFRPDNGRWYAMRWDKSRVFTPAGTEPIWGQAGDVPMLGDLDGTVGDELVVWRPSTGKWLGLRANSPIRIPIWTAGNEPSSGVAGDHPRVAEVTAGAEDLVIFRPATAAWSARTIADLSLFNNLDWGNPSAPARIVGFESDDDLADASTPGGDVYFARTAGTSSGTNDNWWLRAEVLVENVGTAPITVTGFTVDTNQSSPVSFTLSTPVSILPRRTASIQVPGEVTGGGTFPTLLTVYATIAGYVTPVSREANLVEYESGTPSGGLGFPGKSADLDPGVYWGTDHVHKHSPTQRYAYDFSLWRPHGSGWSPRKSMTDGDDNADYLIWELPVYAAEDAIIVRCARSELDHPPWGNGTSNGGNTVVLELQDGTYLSYHHLRDQSIPTALCPMDGPDGDDWTPLSIPVQKGDLLGQVGNTGDSSNPHLHIDLNDGPNPSDSNTRSLPLRFYDVDVVRLYNTNTETVTWNSLSPSESAYLFNVLIDP